MASVSVLAVFPFRISPDQNDGDDGDDGDNGQLPCGTIEHKKITLS